MARRVGFWKLPLLKHLSFPGHAKDREKCQVVKMTYYYWFEPGHAQLLSRTKFIVLVFYSVLDIVSFHISVFSLQLQFGLAAMPPRAILYDFYWCWWHKVREWAMTSFDTFHYEPFNRHRSSRILRYSKASPIFPAPRPTAIAFRLPRRRYFANYRAADYEQALTELMISSAGSRAMRADAYTPPHARL